MPEYFLATHFWICLQVSPRGKGTNVDAAIGGSPQEAWPVGKGLHLDLQAQLFGLAGLGDVLPNLNVRADGANDDGGLLGTRLLGGRGLKGEKSKQDDNYSRNNNDDAVSFLLPHVLALA